MDNLQPDYLYEHMAPVRGSLMQVSWIGWDGRGVSALDFDNIFRHYGVR